MRSVLLLLTCAACGFPRPEHLAGDAGPADAAATSDSADSMMIADAGPMDFSLALASVRVRVVQGASTTVAVTLNRNAFSDPVAITVAGLPSGVTVDPLSITSDTGTLTLHATADATQGEAALTVTAAGGPRSHDAPLSLLAMGVPGTLDRTFGSNGTMLVLGAGAGTSVAVQPDGKIIVASLLTTGNATSSGIRVTRYLSSGAVDESFDGGAVLLPAEQEAGALALQPDGKIIVVGASDRYQAHGLVFRLKPDGKLDDQFGVGGKAQIDFNGLGARPNTKLVSVAVQANGGIVVAGSTEVLVASVSVVHAVVGRLTPTGVPDNSFGTTGRTTTLLGGQLAKFLTLTLQPDGRAVAVGTTRLSNDSTISAFARFTNTGQLDNEFSGDGFLTIDLGSTEAGSTDLDGGAGVAIQSDGKIVAVGGASAIPVAQSCLVRLNGGDGSPDSGFGINGVKAVSLGGSSSTASGVTLQQDGKLIVVGRAVLAENRGYSDGYVARFGDDALLDFSFAGGVASAHTPFTGDDVAHLQSVALDADGRIVSIGLFEANQITNLNLVMVRFWP